MKSKLSKLCKLSLLSRHKSRAGTALAFALIVIAVLAPLVAISIAVSNSRSTYARREGDWSTANSACDSAIEYGFAVWKDWIKTNGGAVPLAANLPSQSDVDATQLAGATYDSRPAVALSLTTIQGYFNATLKFSGVTLNRLDIQALDSSGAVIAQNTSASATTQRTNMRCLLPLEKLPHRVGRAYTYLATATCTKTSRGSQNKVVVTSQRYFRKSDATIWQAMMFFDGDIELFPTPDMPLSGWIHTNSNAYLAHAANTGTPQPELTIKGDFTFTGSPTTLSKGASAKIQDAQGLVYGVSKLQEVDESGWSSFRDPVWGGGGYDSQVDIMPSKLEPFAVATSSIVSTTDTNQNNDSIREIIERPVDTVTAGGNGDGKRTAADDTADFKDRRYYNIADIKIVVNRTLTTVANRIQILDKNDTRIPDTVVNTFGYDVATKVLGRSATTGLPTTKDFYDYRESGNVTSSSAAAADSTTGHVTVTSIDVSKLTPLLNSYSGYSVGVVYFKDETPLGSTGVNNKKAAMLLQGGSLPSIGMTFVTEDGAYVRGDYNTGSTSTYDSTTTKYTMTAQPASNTAGTADVNTVSGYTVKPAAICADAVTFLSNSWADNYAFGTATSGRVGSATTYNAAFMSGYVPTNTNYPTTSTDQRSGGGINFPRVLENWNGTALTYWGSMVQLYNSQVFNTKWTPNIYGAPKRPWNFETAFLNTPPPGPLEFVEYTRGRFVRPLN